MATLEKLAQDGEKPYTTKTAMQALKENVEQITPSDLAVELMPLFEQRTFIEQWIEAFHDNFYEWVEYYLEE